MQELLEFSLAHQAQLAADGDLFGCEEDECCGAMAADSESLAALGSPGVVGLAAAAGDAALTAAPSLP